MLKFAWVSILIIVKINLFLTWTGSVGFFSTKIKNTMAEGFLKILVRKLGILTEGKFSFETFLSLPRNKGIQQKWRRMMDSIFPVHNFSFSYSYHNYIILQTHTYLQGKTWKTLCSIKKNMLDTREWLSGWFFFHIALCHPKPHHLLYKNSSKLFFQHKNDCVSVWPCCLIRWRETLTRVKKKGGRLWLSAGDGESGEDCLLNEENRVTQSKWDRFLSGQLSFHEQSTWWGSLLLSPSCIHAWWQGQEGWWSWQNWKRL